MRSQLKTTFEDIASMDNLLEAWGEFIKGKRSKKDVQAFGLHLMDNLMDLHYDLVHRSYQHGPYHAFSISDPKPRSIHKASVRDRVLHHAIYKKLYPFFDRTFTSDSYSCRLNKGTHKALKRFRIMMNQVSRSNTQTCWVIKCDIKKFFASIDQDIMLYILSTYIPDHDILWLLERIVKSFSTAPNTGLPLGNLTSQLLVNIYMNEFDQYVKHILKAKHYLRYADDFVLISDDQEWLEQKIEPISRFLEQCLHLSLHPRKVSIQTLASGTDFLGWVHFPGHKVLRTTTKRRMKQRIKQSTKIESLNSYLGLMQHGNTYQLKRQVLSDYWVDSQTGAIRRP
ncbi:MAG: reverse transcriptase domain-containing protein [bacterium]|nr:reverse transcriptase domain-containing protein [bacterium]